METWLITIIFAAITRHYGGTVDETTPEGEAMEALAGHILASGLTTGIYGYAPELGRRWNPHEDEQRIQIMDRAIEMAEANVERASRRLRELKARRWARGFHEKFIPRHARLGG